MGEAVWNCHFRINLFRNYHLQKEVVLYKHLQANKNSNLEMRFNELNHFFIKINLTYKSLSATDVEVTILR